MWWAGLRQHGGISANDQAVSWSIGCQVLQGIEIGASWMSFGATGSVFYFLNGALGDHLLLRQFSHFATFGETGEAPNPKFRDRHYGPIHAFFPA
jgi:hypothetical protein